MLNSMNDFDPDADRLKEAKMAATLAKLREAASDPGAADRIAEAAVQEPDPARVHVALLQRNFPWLRRPNGWIPTLSDLGCLAELKTYFSPPAVRKRQQIERHFREYFSASPARQRQMEIETLGHPLRSRRSIWNRLAFWR